MNARNSRALAALMIGLGCAAVSGAARAESDTTTLHAEMREICAELGGRFEETWRYNDQGVQWGRVASCSTSAGHVICQGSVCQTSRQALSKPRLIGKGPDSNGSTAKIPSNSSAIAGALAALSIQ